MAGRLTGKNGSVRLPNSALLTDTFVWEYEEMMEVVPASVKGENFQIYRPDVTTARVRITSYLQAGSPLTAPMDSNRVNSAGVGGLVTFDLRGIEANTTTVTRVQGTGWLIRAQLRVPRDGLITDELEIQVDGTVTVTII